MSAATNATPGLGRRALRFNSIDEVLAELDRIAAAESAGTLRRGGTWTPGQIFGHLAAWINYGYEGYPFRVPWFIRLILRFRVKRYLTKGMPGGARIPNVPGGTYGIDELPATEGAQRLRAALQRLRHEPATFHSPAFGPMSHEDRIALTLRHAELHLGFLHY